MPIEVFIEELVTMLSGYTWGRCAAGVTRKARGRNRTKRERSAARS
jgi:hypothetical protein